MALLLLLLFCHRRKQRREENDNEFPKMIPISTGYEPNGSNAYFMGVTPFSNSSTNRPNSEFIQDTIFSPSSRFDAPRSTVYDNSTAHNSTYSLSTTNHHEPMPTDSTFVQALPNGQIVMSPGPTSGTTLLLPLGQTSQDHTTEEVRRVRQLEIDRQMRAVKQEMRDMKTDFHMEATQGVPVTSGGRSEETEMKDMRDQIRMMKDQIEYLQSQQESPWAQGLTDEPPPGYSARRN